MIALLGMVTEDDASYNYLKNGNVLAQGAPVIRHFGIDSYEMYAQDSWKIKPNLTITFGLRYSLVTPPWETTGLQVAPCQLSGSTCKELDLGSWFDQRGTNMGQGIGSTRIPPCHSSCLDRKRREARLLQMGEAQHRPAPRARVVSASAVGVAQILVWHWR